MVALTIGLVSPNIRRRNGRLGNCWKPSRGTARRAICGTIRDGSYAEKFREAIKTLHIFSLAFDAKEQPSFITLVLALQASNVCRAGYTRSGSDPDYFPYRGTGRYAVVPNLLLVCRADVFCKLFFALLFVSVVRNFGSRTTETKCSAIRGISVAVPTHRYMKLRGYGIDSIDGQINLARPRYLMTSFGRPNLIFPKAVCR